MGHSELLSFLPAPAVLSPGGPAIPGHLWLRPSVPESPELLDTGPLGRNLLVSLSHLFPPDPAGPAPPFGSLFPSSSQPGSQRPTRSFLSCFLAFSREEGLSRWLAGSLAHSSRSHFLSRPGPEEQEHAPGKFSDVRLGCRIMEPSPCPLINESGATAAVTQAAHEKELVALWSGSLRWVCSEPGGGEAAPRRVATPQGPRHSAVPVIPREWGRMGAGGEPAMAPAPSSAAAWHTPACLQRCPH